MLLSFLCCCLLFRSFGNRVRRRPCLLLTPLYTKPKRRLCAAELTHLWLAGCSRGKQLSHQPSPVHLISVCIREHLQARLGARAWGREQGRSQRRVLLHGHPRIQATALKHMILWESGGGSNPPRRGVSGRDFSPEIDR